MDKAVEKELRQRAGKEGLGAQSLKLIEDKFQRRNRNISKETIGTLI